MTSFSMAPIWRPMYSFYFLIYYLKITVTTKEDNYTSLALKTLNSKMQTYKVRMNISFL